MEHPIPSQLLMAFGQLFPKVWRTLSWHRENPGNHPSPPNWCYMPISLSCFIMGDEIKKLDRSQYPYLMEKLEDFQTLPSAITAFYEWRLSKGIYRFNETLYNQIIDMPLSGDLPSEVFYSLPEWCIYIETPDNLFFYEDPILGFFVHLDYDFVEKSNNLRFLLIDKSQKCYSTRIRLNEKTLKSSIREIYNISSRIDDRLGIDINEVYSDDAVDKLVEQIMPFVNLTLYICSVNADILTFPNIKHQKPQKSRQQNSIANQPIFWDIGTRIGPALKNKLAQEYKDNSVQSENSTEISNRRSLRPHYRRGHWHHYWTGPRRSDERKLVLKWISPVPVGINIFDDDSNLPTVIHPVSD